MEASAVAELMILVADLPLPFRRIEDAVCFQVPTPVADVTSSDSGLLPQGCFAKRFLRCHVGGNIGQDRIIAANVPVRVDVGDQHGVDVTRLAVHVLDHGTRKDVIV